MPKKKRKKKKVNNSNQTFTEFTYYNFIPCRLFHRRQVTNGHIDGFGIILLVVYFSDNLKIPIFISLI